MIFKIKTSKKTMQIFQEIGASENLQPFILAKLSIAASLIYDEPLSDKDKITDTYGLELNRQTITGNQDLLFKVLIEEYEGLHISEDDYLPVYLKSHLDRGAKLIYADYRFGGDFLSNLINNEKSL